MRDFIVVTALLALVSCAPQKHEVLSKSYSYQVALFYYGSHICGGSIISSRYVITAAQCTEASGVYTVRAGSYILDSGGTIVSVSTIYEHPFYNSSNFDFDISILHLSSDLSLGYAIGIISLPISDQRIIPGEQATVTGWGALLEDGAFPSILQVVRLPVISQVDCRAVYGESSITDRMLCAGGDSKDACQGDAGGPLVVNGQLIGIVSWGRGCGRPTYPGVYSSVPALRSYVKKITGI